MISKSCQSLAVLERDACSSSYPAIIVISLSEPRQLCQATKDPLLPTATNVRTYKHSLA